MCCGRNSTPALFILMGAFSIASPARVFWRLGQDVIELGKSLTLQCTIFGMDYVLKDTSRQWTGEIDNRLFTFNGVSTCPSNYTEILEPPNSFKIYFNSTAMFNLNSPYSCRVGTMFDEKVLTVNESNFIYMPTARTTKWFESYNGSYMLNFNIEKVYPKPTCRIIIGKSSFNFSMITEQKQLEGFLYNVTFHYKLSKEVQYCRKNLSVRCIVSSWHNRLYNYTVGQLQQCQSGKKTHDSRQRTVTMITVAISVLLFICTLLVCVTKCTHVICKRTQLDEKNTGYHAVSVDTDTKSLAFHRQKT
ncbi:uncharacterized protein LOC143058873 [Mytilus galloprovincialis]|uniref:uncharacterized protein LOC143058873 n=1 Tax=Mytilus galloprovincialis TaxID=29158 RepID=UPI003F7C3AE9